MLWVEVKDEELECVVTRSSVSPDLARMTNSFGLELAKASRHSERKSPEVLFWALDSRERC